MHRVGWLRCPATAGIDDDDDQHGDGGDGDGNGGGDSWRSDAKSHGKYGIDDDEYSDRGKRQSR